MSEYPKDIKRLLGELASEAYERELSYELVRLDHSFAAWRAGQINSSELSHRIHQYETNISKELYKKYNEGKNDFNVAYAITTGILDRQAIPEKLLMAIERHLSFYEALKKAGQLRLPGE